MSDSVKTKQAVSTLLSEKQALAKQFQQVNVSLDSLKTRICQSEEQVCVSVVYTVSLVVSCVSEMMIQLLADEIYYVRGLEPLPGRQAPHC